MIHFMPRNLLFWGKCLPPARVTTVPTGQDGGAAGSGWMRPLLCTLTFLAFSFDSVPNKFLFLTASLFTALLSLPLCGLHTFCLHLSKWNGTGSFLSSTLVPVNHTLLSCITKSTPKITIILLIIRLLRTPHCKNKKSSVLHLFFYLFGNKVQHSQRWVQGYPSNKDRDIKSETQKH